MRRRFCLIGALGIFPFFPLIAQTNAQTNMVVGAGYTAPAPLNAAPGQVITLFVDGVGKSLTQAVRTPDGSWPTSLAGISVTLLQGTKIPVPILEVRPIPTCGGPFPVLCGAITAVTVQIPYELISLCPLCLRPVGPSPELLVTENGQDGVAIGITPLADQVHVLTSCDILLQPDSPSVNLTGLPCPPMVIHGDGQLVSAANPAKPGEELAAYAVGLGPTDPPATAGQPAAAPVPTAQTFLIDYSFRANALPTKPAEGSAVPLFTGLTPTYPGLYQINFVVPPAPEGTKPCAELIPFGATNFIQSNLTVSFGGAYSFDGAGICVAVPN
jgi:uncharacterized protein (TIGR03437 family)